MIRLILLAGAIVVAGCSQSQDNTALDELVVQAKHPDPNMRYSALEQIGNLGPAGKEAVPTLIGGLSDKDATVRMGAAYAIGKIGPDASNAVTPLMRNLSDSNKQVRLAVAYVLPALGEAAQSAIPDLEKRLNDPDVEVRSQSARSIKSIRTSTRVRQSAEKAERVAAADSKVQEKPQRTRSRRRKG
jgi:HEAT repeat protein